MFIKVPIIDVFLAGKANNIQIKEVIMFFLEIVNAGPKELTNKSD